MLRRVFTVVIALVIVFAGVPLLASSPYTAQAQGGPMVMDPGADPNFGSVDLITGFTPEPFTVQITAGGFINAQDALGSMCFGDAAIGFVSGSPDFRVYYTAGLFQELDFVFTAQEDTVLIINAPDKRWYCSDDADGFNPALAFAPAVSGQYDIWVGSLNQNNTPVGTLAISEAIPVSGNQPPPGGPGGQPPAGPGGQPPAGPGGQPPQQPPGGGATLDISQSPNYGSADLQAGFTPDPHTVQITSGGPVSIVDAVGSVCQGAAQGFATSAPDYRVQYTAGGFNELRFFFVGQGDTTMVINGPDGQWYCNDDADGTLNPMIVFSGPQSGQYDIWVGSYTQGEFVPGTLYITETAIGPGSVAGGPGGQPPQQPPQQPPGGQPPQQPPGGQPPQQPPVAGGTLDPSQPPNFGSVSLQSGFTPDPHTVQITSGGPVVIPDAVGSVCQGAPSGFAASAPDYRVQYTAGGGFNELRFFFVGQGDTTMVINGPNGQWYCNDDADGTLNPMIIFNNPQSGQYDIWVGSFNPGEFVPGTLYITETAIGPGNF